MSNMDNPTSGQSVTETPAAKFEVEYGVTVADALRFLKREPRHCYLAGRTGLDGLHKFLAIGARPLRKMLTDDIIERSDRLPSEFCATTRHLWIGNHTALVKAEDH